MKLVYNESGKNRKKMVDIIAEAIGQEGVYAKAPTYNYNIGEFTVDKDGTLIFDSATIDEEQVRVVIDTLKENGFTYDDSANIIIGYPAANFTDESFANLQKLVASKASLIRQALGLPENHELPIERNDVEVNFDWFKSGLSSDEVKAYAQFVTALCKTAIAKKRVTATAEEHYSNPKFSFRVFLISLNMKGADFALARKLLLQNLSGDSGQRFSNPEDRTSRQRGERVHKEVVSVRFTPEILEQLAELASQSHMSRNQLIESVVCEYAQGVYANEPPLEDSEDDSETES